MSPVTSTDGIVTITPTSDGSFSFIYDIKCGNTIKDNASVTGLYNPIALSDATINVLDGEHFTTTTYNALTDNNLTKPSSTADYRLHQEGKDEGIIGWGLDTDLTGGSAEIWWSNEDGANSNYDSMGLIIEIGSYNGGNISIFFTDTLLGASTSTDYTPSSITIPSNITWNYLQIRSVDDDTGQDPILWEVRINNIPN